MTKKITLIALFFITTIASAQLGPVGHLTIFSEDGDKFTLILNGELMNDIPQTNLRVEDLNQPYYNAKIKFEDQSLQEVSKNNLIIADGDGNFADVTYKIKRDKNKSGKMKLNYFSAIPVQPNFVPASNVHVIHYGQPRPVVVQQVGGVTQTTTTTSQSGGVNVGVNVGGAGGINMGVSINDSMGGEVVQTTTTTTTHSGNTVLVEETPLGCNGRSCISSRDFNAAMTTLNSQNFEDTRLKTAKQIVSANCLNVDQIMQIAQTFNFEDNSLEFAKFAYDFCIEPRNYFKLNGIFKFSSNADALSDYVESRN